MEQTKEILLIKNNKIYDKLNNLIHEYKDYHGQSYTITKAILIDTNNILVSFEINGFTGFHNIKLNNEIIIDKP